MRGICALILILIFCDFSQADNFFGLTVPCENCEIRENPCSLVIGPDSFSCEAGLLKILKSIKSDGPSYQEIRKYLSEYYTNEAIFNELIRLLEKTNVQANDQTEQIKIVENFIKHAKGQINSRALFLLTQAIEQVAFSKYESSRRKLVREEQLETLQKFSEQDLALKQVLSLLLVHAAQDALLQAEADRANWLLAKSREVYPDLYPERDRLYAELVQDPQLKEKPRITVSKEVIRKKISKPKNLKLFILAALSLWLIFLISYYFFTKEPKKQSQKAKAKDSKMDELFDFFDIDENSTEEDLNRNYRKMAKAVHPDVGAHGLDYDFHKLQNMYEQARRIIFKIK